jgi:TonB family protein
MNHAVPRIGTFALLSLAAHLSVLTMWQPEVLIHGYKDNILSISLMDTTPVLPTVSSLYADSFKMKALSKKARDSRIDQNTETVLVEMVNTPAAMRITMDQAALETNDTIAGVQTEKTKSDSTQGTPAASTPSTTVEGTGEQHGPVRARIRTRLLSDLTRYFDYPAVARQRGWEGTVLLGLRVESNGHLEKIRIEHSSGYAVLDNSALNSLNRLDRLAEASAWLNGSGLDMQLPVIYRLIDN